MSNVISITQKLRSRSDGDHLEGRTPTAELSRRTSDNIEHDHRKENFHCHDSEICKGVTFLLCHWPMQNYYILDITPRHMLLCAILIALNAALRTNHHHDL